MRAKMVASGTNATSGTALIILNCGTVWPVFLAYMATGGVTIPEIIIDSSALL